VKAAATLEYLQLMASMRAGMLRDHRRTEFHYLGYEDLVLREGVVFADPAGPSPRKFGRTGKRDCFENALHAAMESGDLTYVEGWAMGSVIAVHHAWVADEDGNVHDPTWGWLGEPGGYVGVPFEMWYACERTYERNLYGILDYEGVDLESPLAEDAVAALPNTAPVPDEYRKPHPEAAKLGAG
jgi:hypothetical protein